MNSAYRRAHREMWAYLKRFPDATAEEIAALHPSFVSVTYGAGGGTSVYMVTHAESTVAGCTADMLRLHFHDNQGLVITYQGSSLRSEPRHTNRQTHTSQDML